MRSLAAFIAVILLAICTQSVWAQITAAPPGPPAELNTPLIKNTQEQIDKDKANEVTQALFDTTYEIQTRTYPMTYISPETAYEMIRDELHNFQLQWGQGGKLVIVVKPQEADQGVAAKQLQESVFVDNRTKLLVVKAAAPTLKKIEKLISQIDIKPSSAFIASDRQPAQIEVVLLRSDAGSTIPLPASISPKDLQSLGVKSVAEAGRAVVMLAPEKGELGRVKAKLGDAYGVELAFQDYRQPYLVLRGSLLDLQKQNGPSQEVLTLGSGTTHEFQGLTLQVGNIDPTEGANITVATPGSGSGTRLIMRENEPQIIGDFTIVANEIKSKAKPTGSVRLTITYKRADVPFAPAGVAKAGQPDETEIKLSRGESANFQHAKFTLVRVDKNDSQDQKDDTAELKIDIFGVGLQQATIQEMQTQVIGEYEIEAADVEPGNGNGEGRAVFKVRYMPQAMQQQMQQMMMLNAMSGRSEAIIENTVLLEPGKPQLLGVTNMHEALILVLKWQK